MIKQHSLYLLLIGLFFSCETQNNDMDIRNTSLNDFQATYIFNLKNDINTLKLINDYALNDIKAQQQFIDSLKNSAIQNNKPISFQDRINSTTLSTTPEDIIFYTPPTELIDRVRENDIIIHYVLNPETFDITHIKVGNNYTNNTVNIETVFDNKNCTLTIDKKDVTLEALHSVFKKIDQLQHQNNYLNFNYTIKNKDNKTLLNIAFKDNGKSLLLNYN